MVLGAPVSYKITTGIREGHWGGFEEVVGGLGGSRGVHVSNLQTPKNATNCDNLLEMFSLSTSYLCHWKELYT